VQRSGEKKSDESIVCTKNSEPNATRRWWGTTPPVPPHGAGHPSRTRGQDGLGLADRVEFLEDLLLQRHVL